MKLVSKSSKFVSFENYKVSLICKKYLNWIKKENYWNRQKLPEVSDRKKGRRMRKVKGTSRQEEEAHSLSGSDRRSDNTLLTGGRRHAVAFGRSVG